MAVTDTKASKKRKPERPVHIKKARKTVNKLQAPLRRLCVDYMKEQNFKPREFSEECLVSFSTIYRFVNGGELDMINFIKLTDFFNLTETLMESIKLYT